MSGDASKAGLRALSRAPAPPHRLRGGALLPAPYLSTLVLLNSIYPCTPCSICSGTKLIQSARLVANPASVMLALQQACVHSSECEPPGPLQ